MKKVKTENAERKKLIKALAFTGSLFASGVLHAGHLYQGTIDGADVPKYVSPLVAPPIMPEVGRVQSWLSKPGGGTKKRDIPYYEIAVRQFRQQILPAGDWNGDGTADYPPTTVWSYGAAADKNPDGSAKTVGQGGTFFYPAFTIEARRNEPLRVRWINDLVDANGNYLPHLLPVDQTLHWANPPQDCRKNLLDLNDGPIRTDCRGRTAEPYTGPVPMVAHLHGAHVGGESDGYPEAWWLPAAKNIPAGFATNGVMFGDITTATGLAGPGTKANDGASGYADYQYPNDQPGTTLWFHDHTLGMTRANVYAGPAGFYLLRDKRQERLLGLPQPAPKSSNLIESSQFKEIPIVIQDRSFNADGSLFYPESRARFDGYNGPYFPQTDANGDLASDIPPIWNPEAFFETMVVNGRTWPYLDVESKRYRFRLLNGCNSRFLNLDLTAYDADGNLLGEVPFYQIGSDGGLLPRVVEVSTGFKTGLPGNGTIPVIKTPASAADEALLVGPAERMDVIVDFSRLPADTAYVLMGNSAPDAPFGGFPIDPAEMADADSTGQVMKFNLVQGEDDPDPSTPVENLVMPGMTPLVPDVPVRRVSLHEEESSLTFEDAEGTLPIAPLAALLGTWDETLGGFQPLLWSDPIRVNPAVGSTEVWEINNFTEDAHPIHLHLVQFQVQRRATMDGSPIDRDADGTPDCTGSCTGTNESGWKDTVVAYPGEVTRVVARFDNPGLYVWHCHILEHEDNEMMLPFCVGEAGKDCPSQLFDPDGTATPGI